MRFARSLSLALLAAMASLAPAGAFAQDQVSLSRYTSVTPTPQPEQMDPLKTVVSVEFPRGTVRTVGDAAALLLQRTGYRLGQGGGASAGHARLTGFPLPEVHRRFEVVAVERILAALAAPSYEPRIDHVNRRVSFALAGDAADRPSTERAPETVEPQQQAEEAPPLDFLESGADWLENARPEDLASSDKTAAAGSGGDETVTAGGAAREGSMRARLETLASDLAGLRGEIGSLQDAFAKTHDSLSAEVVAAKARHGEALAALETRIAGLGDGLGGPIAAARQKLAAYETALAQLAGEPEARAVEAPAGVLPFEVHSIDLWARSPQLTVSRDGPPVYLSVGDVYRGWTVTGIDWPRRAFTLADPGGQTGAYRLAGGRLVAEAPAAGSGSHSGVLPRLTVETHPGDARVRVMNIEPVYHDAMALAPGPYDILVDAPGHRPYRAWHRLYNENRVIKVALEAVK